MSSKIDQAARYQKTHEWARMTGPELTVGITDHAQEELSDLVYVELPRVGTKFAKGDVFGSVESVKAASDLYMPAAGTITATNTDLEKAPEVINKDPYGSGWLIKVKPDNPAELDTLLDAAAYEKFLQEEG